MKGLRRRIFEAKNHLIHVLYPYKDETLCEQYVENSSGQTWCRRDDGSYITCFECLRLYAIEEEATDNMLKSRRQSPWDFEPWP